MFKENFNRMKVEAQDEEGFSVDEKGQGLEQKQFIEEKIKEAEEFIDQHRDVLALFNGDSSLEYVPGQGFAYYPEENKISYDLKVFIEKGMTPRQIVWSLCHEGGHFRDKRENPEVYLENFVNIRETAKEKITPVLEKKYREKFGESHPDIVDKITEQIPIDKNDSKKGTMNSLEAVAYEKLHRLYNILDDIYDNDLVENRSQQYAQGDGKTEVENLYKKLFPENNYQKLPRHLSFDLLLRSEMVENEEHIPHPDAQKAFDEFSFLGKDLSALIQSDLKYQKKGQSDPGKRYRLIREMIEPLYLELLQKDLEEFDPPLPQEKKGGSSGEGDGDFENLDPFADQTPELPGHSEEKGSKTFDKINKDLKPAKKAKEAKDEANLSPEERKKLNEKRKKAEFDREFEINPALRNLYDKRMKQIDPYRQEMMEFWKSLIYRKGKKYNTEYAKSVKGEFNVGRFIKEYSENEEKIRSGKAREIDSFDRKELREIPTNKPELIKVRVVGDISGSMKQGRRMEILQKSILLLLSSIDSFNKYLDLSRRQSKSKLKTDTETWVYNNQSKKIKDFSVSKNTKQKQADIINTFKYLQRASGSNEEYWVLKEINDSLNKKAEAEIKNGKTLEIVFFITDGGMGSGGGHSLEDIIGQIEIMAEKGVIPVGFQIGSDDESEKQIFDKVFNQDQEKSHGVFIGSQIENLPKELIRKMKELLGNVRI